MMESMTGCGPMMWGMMALGVLLLVLIILGAGALVRYLFGSRKK